MSAVNLVTNNNGPATSCPTTRRKTGKEGKERVSVHVSYIVHMC